MQPLKILFITILILCTFCTSYASQDNTIQKLIQQIDTTTKKAKLYNQLSQAYLKISNEKSLESAKEALQFAQQDKDSIEIANSFNHIGTAYSNLGIYNKSIEFYLKSLTLFEKLGNQQKVADLYCNLGLTYMDLEDYPKSLDYLKKSLAIGQPLNNLDFLASINQNFGAIYQEMGESDKAFTYHERALELYLQLNDSIGIAQMYNNFGNFAHEQNQLEKAIEYFNKSLLIKTKLGDLHSIGLSHSNMAIMFVSEERYDEAYKHIKELHKIATKTNSLILKNSAFFLLTTYYEEKNNIPKAYDYLNEYLITLDSLYKLQKTAVIANLEDRYKIEAQDKEIELLKKDNQIQILESKKHKFQRNATLVLSLLITLLSIGIFAAYSMIRKRNRRLAVKNKKLKESEQIQKELNGTKDKLFSIIAHDLINPFNAILGFSTFLHKNYFRMEEKDRIHSAQNIHEASQQAFNLLNNLLQWARSQTNKLSYRPSALNLFSIVKQNVLLHESNAREKSIDIQIAVDENSIVYSDEHLLSTVIRNLLSNAIKFTNPNGRITLRSEKKDGMMEVSVSDNGVGIDKTNLEQLFKMEQNNSQPGTLKEPGTGLGLVLCKEFVEKNRGKIWVESELGKGSSFIFTVPLSKD
ncbi:MAG: tetratricopeptide repeat protein [Marinifilaceae bacterium]